MSENQNDQDGRPEVMDNLTDTELGSLDEHVDADDHEGFDRLAASFGWDKAVCQAVWDYLHAKPNIQ